MNTTSESLLFRLQHKNKHRERGMANRFGMDKSLASKQLRAAGYSERRITKTLNISRGAACPHLASNSSNNPKAQTGVPTEDQ